MNTTSEPEIEHPIRKPKSWKSSWIIRIPLIILAGMTSCSLLFYFIEVTPRYNVVPIPSPNAYMGGGGLRDWYATTYSTRLEPIIPDVLNSRVFVWRREVSGSYNNKYGITSWSSVVAYFDEKLLNYGWVRTREYTPCPRYMPEAKFLPEGQDGYVYYRPKGYEPMLDYDGGDFVCLAVWSEEEGSYSVVLVSIRQSILNMLASIG